MARYRTYWLNIGSDEKMFDREYKDFLTNTKAIKRYLDLHPMEKVEFYKRDTGIVVYAKLYLERELDDTGFNLFYSFLFLPEQVGKGIMFVIRNKPEGAKLWKTQKELFEELGYYG